VLGGSKSATDIAVNAVNSGAAEVTLVYREPVWRIPYFIGGLVNFKRILYIRAQEEMFRAGASARCRGSRMRSQSRWSGPTGADWRAC
jgi:cation diffusion facilitator CzcD-associated flavoprotein CzcO